MNTESKYLVSDYFATGEGRTIMLMITYQEDFKVEFTERFNEYFAIGMEELDKKTFFKRYKDFIPKKVKHFEHPWFEWHASFYFNLS